MTSKAVKLDDQTYDRLKELAARRQRTPHWLMKEAIRQFLEREETADQIHQDTLERWERMQQGEETIPAEKVEAWLRSWGTSKELPCPVPTK